MGLNLRPGCKPDRNHLPCKGSEGFDRRDRQRSRDQKTRVCEGEWGFSVGGGGIMRSYRNVVVSSAVIGGGR